MKTKKELFHDLIDKSETSDLLKTIKPKYKKQLKSTFKCGGQIIDIFRIKDNRSICTFVIIDEEDKKHFDFIFEALNFIEL